MAVRRDYYFRQKVTEAELDAGFEGLEQADFNIAIDHDFTGINTGLTVAEAAVPDLTVDVALGTAYSKQGERIRVSGTQNVDCSQDDGGTPTAVAVPGNTKVVSVFIEFDRALSDPRIDGNSLTVYFVRAESFAFSVVQGAEAAIGAEVPPPLDSAKLLLADIRLVNGGTTITNAGVVGVYDQIDTTRREDAFKFTGGTVEIEEGTAYDGIDALLTALNNHIDGAANKHPADEVTYSDVVPWLDGTSLGGATVVDDVQEAILWILTDLSLDGSGNDGGLKVGKYQSGTWHDGTRLATGSVSSQIDAIVSGLAATAGNGGGDKIGISGQSSGAMSVSDGSIYDQIGELLVLLVGKAGLADDNTFSGTTNTFNTDIDVVGDVDITGALDVSSDLTLDDTLTFTEIDTLAEILRSLMSVTPPNHLVTNWGRCLIFNFDADYASNQMMFRLYGTSGSITVGQEAFEIAINCWWNGGTAGTWNQQDTSFPSQLYRFGSVGLQIFNKESGASGSWTDASWDQTFFEIDPDTSERVEVNIEDGHISFINASASASSNASNITQGTAPTPNTLYSKNICKAWGYIEINNSGIVTGAEGFNIDTPTSPGSSSQLDIVFSTALDDGDFACVASDMTGKNEQHIPINESTTGFSLNYLDADTGAAILHNVAIHQVAFIVFGTDS